MFAECIAGLLSATDVLSAVVIKRCRTIMIYQSLNERTERRLVGSRACLLCNSQLSKRTTWFAGVGYMRDMVCCLEERLDISLSNGAEWKRTNKEVIGCMPGRSRSGVDPLRARARLKISSR